MNVSLNYKSSRKISAITEQELFLKQRLSQEGIPFTFQQEFHLNDQCYIIDFFIANTIVLECSSTSMIRYNTALKQKALQLEFKSSQLKKRFSYPIWVLLESQRPIGSSLITTLIRLMPSVDRFLTSSAMLFEDLRGITTTVGTNSNIKHTPPPKSLIPGKTNSFDQELTGLKTRYHLFTTLNQIFMPSNIPLFNMSVLQDSTRVLAINEKPVKYSQKMNLNSIGQMEGNL